jgi:Tfp pilus assembly protein PilV
MAAVILAVGLIGLLGLLDTSVKASASTRAREGATSLAREILEDAHTIPYAQVISSSIESQLQTMNALEDSSSASGWQIDRRGFTYTVTAKECAIDNPKDGLAEAHGSSFCTEQANWTEGTKDTAPEDLKRITVEVSWTLGKRTSTVQQTATLTAAGQGVGLIATGLQITSEYNTTLSNSTATTPVITDKEAKTLTFSVSFPEGTSAIIWSLEGAKQQEITPSSKATSLTFSWTINESTKGIYVSDGTYQVSAEAVDSTGIIGPPISIPVRLIRGTPAAPKGVLGGFNTILNSGVATEVGELQWKANTERNVIGYRVYAGTELLCPSSGLETLSTATSCIDFKLPNKSTERKYTVYALYRNAYEEVSQSPSTTLTIKRTESVAPNAPTSLVATKNADGSVTLKWTAPTGTPTPAFYRIYRGSKNYTSRYGETTLTEYTDTETGTTHEYWVTAAGSSLTESAFLGPVIS